jgi:hypothetical protein
MHGGDVQQGWQEIGQHGTISDKDVITPQHPDWWNPSDHAIDIARRVAHELGRDFDQISSWGHGSDYVFWQRVRDAILNDPQSSPEDITVFQKTPQDWIQHAAEMSQGPMNRMALTLGLKPYQLAQYLTLDESDYIEGHNWLAYTMPDVFGGQILTPEDAYNTAMEHTLRGDPHASEYSMATKDLINLWRTLGGHAGEDRAAAQRLPWLIAFHSFRRADAWTSVRRRGVPGQCGIACTGAHDGRDPTAHAAWAAQRG